jgi:NodT family efflux transporter outer membrane factor (OMF) lipoprotein
MIHRQASASSASASSISGLLRLAPLALSLLLGGCALGPDFLRPEVKIPPAYREAKGWKTAEPAAPSRDDVWWERYGDPLLNELVGQVDSANQTVLAAEARYRQAQAVVSASRAAFFPTLGSSVSATRAESNSSTTSGSNTNNPIRNTDKLGLSSSWEIDLWGRISRSVESSRGSAEASAADLAAARLSAQATLAQNYLQLRVTDAQLRLLQRTIATYQRSWEITRNRYEAGVASQADVAQAETQLRTTQAQATDLGLQRVQLEQAIAILVGKTPAEFSIAEVEAVPEAPLVPAQFPSLLLERRPDIAAAERRVAAANAQIGVAQAAFFPALTISASGGYQNTSFADLISLPNRFWSLGPSLALTLFDGGARAAVKEQAVAAYDQTVATYRQTVLTAFQEVEGNLAALRLLAEEREIQRAAVRAANQFQELTNNQYLAGTVSYLNVATAQASALSAERSSLDLQNRQLAASVALVKALGGGAWK